MPNAKFHADLLKTVAVYMEQRTHTHTLRYFQFHIYTVPTKMRHRFGLL